MQTAEHGLWRTVIYTIFDDADRDIAYAKSVEFLDLQASKRILETKSKHFEWMCLLIEIHPDWIRRSLLAKYDVAKKDFHRRLQHPETSLTLEALK